MTIAAGIACPEGLVIAADSRSSVQLPAGHRVASDYSNKVFEITGAFVGATFGWGMLEGKTISSHVHDFATQQPVPNDVTQAATALGTYFQQRIQAHIAAGLDPPPPPGSEPLGFLFAGYDANGVGRLLRVWPFGGTVQDAFQTTKPGGIWNGAIDVMTRLYKGHDATRLNVSRWAKRSKDALADVEFLSPFGWLTLQDAIDWSLFVVRTTIDTQRFTNGTVGTPGASVTCGGAVQVATVTPQGVAWIRRTALSG